MNTRPALELLAIALLLLVILPCADDLNRHSALKFLAIAKAMTRHFVLSASPALCAHNGFRKFNWYYNVSSMIKDREPLSFSYLSDTKPEIANWRLPCLLSVYSVMLMISV